MNQTNLRLASMHWMRREPLPVTLERLARTGYDSIMLNGDPERYDPGEVRAALEEHGLTAWGVVTLMDASRDLVNSDQGIRTATQAYFRDSIRLASECGGEVLCCTPSSIGKLAPSSDAASEWRWAVEGLRAAGDYAGSLGVRIAVEAITRFETYFLNTADQALQLVAEVDMPSVGVCLDAYHMNMEEDDPIAAVRAAGPLLFDFHVAESNRKPPGRGLIPWKETLAVVREVGYTGALTAEVEYPRDRTPLTATPEDASGELAAGFYDAISAETATYVRSVLGSQS